MTLKTFFLSLLCLCFSASCARKQEDTGKLSLRFEWETSTYRAKEVSTLAVTPTFDNLQRVMVNVSGSGFAQIAPEPWNRRNSADQAQVAWDISVPRGTGRLVQVLLVFGDQGNFVFYYGESTIDVQSDVVSVNLSTEPAGAELGDGQIAGRYLDASGNGPTGQVIMRFKPATGKQSMIVDTSDIYAGWFSIFALQNQAFDYTLENGTELFSNLTTNNMDVSGNSKIKVYMPPYYSCDGGDTCTTRKSRQNKTMILGWFGPGGTDKKICYPSGRKELTGTYVDSTSSTYRVWNGTSYVTADNANGEAGVIAGGIGLASSLGSDCGTTDYSDYLFFDSSSVTNGDRPLQFSGPYKPVSTAADGGYSGSLVSTTLSAGTYTLTWNYLPDTDKAQYPAQKSVLGSGLFYKINLTDMHDDHGDLECSRMGENGFNFIGDYERNTVSATLTPTNLVRSDGTSLDATTFESYLNSGKVKFALCPYFATAGSPRYFNKAISIYGGGGNYGGGNYSGGPATKLAIEGSRMVNVNSGGSSICQNYYVYLKDSNNYMADSSENTNGISVSLALTSSGGSISSSCSNPTGSPSLSITVPVSSNMVSFAYRPGTSISPHTDSLTATSSGLTQADANIYLVQSGQATNVDFVKSDNSQINAVLTNTCVEVHLKATDSNKSTPTSPTSLSLSVSASMNGSSSGVALFSDSSCTTSLSSNSIDVSNSGTYISAAFYMKATSSGRLNLSAQNSSGITKYHELHAATANQAVTLEVSSTNNTLTTSSCESLTITSKNAASPPVATPLSATSPVTINLSTSYGTFYLSASDCSAGNGGSSSTTVSMAINATSAGSNALYFKPNSNSYAEVNATANFDGRYIYGYKSFNSGGGSYTLDSTFSSISTSLATIKFTGSFSTGSQYTIEVGGTICSQTATMSSYFTCSISGTWTSGASPSISLYSGSTASGTPLATYNSIVVSSVSFISPSTSYSVANDGSDTISGTCITGATVYVRITTYTASSTTCVSGCWSLNFSALTGFASVTASTSFTVQAADNSSFTNSANRSFTKL